LLPARLLLLLPLELQPGQTTNLRHEITVRQQRQQ
jgi:hypothetical protein